MARHSDRWRMYLMLLAMDMRDGRLIDDVAYRRIIGRIDEMTATELVEAVERWVEVGRWQTS